MDFEGFAVFQVCAYHLECMLCCGFEAGRALLGTAHTGYHSVTCTSLSMVAMSA